jgi:hypothetical protein
MFRNSFFVVPFLRRLLSNRRVTKKNIFLLCVSAFLSRLVLAAFFRPIRAQQAAP